MKELPRVRTIKKYRFPGAGVFPFSAAQLGRVVRDCTRLFASDGRAVNLDIPNPANGVAFGAQQTPPRRDLRQIPPRGVKAKFPKESSALTRSKNDPQPRLTTRSAPAGIYTRRYLGSLPRERSNNARVRVCVHVLPCVCTHGVYAHRYCARYFSLSPS